MVHETATLGPLITDSQESGHFYSPGYLQTEADPKSAIVTERFYKSTMDTALFEDVIQVPLVSVSRDQDYVRRSRNSVDYEMMRSLLRKGEIIALGVNRQTSPPANGQPG